MGYDNTQEERTKRWQAFWIALGTVMVVAAIVAGIAYGNTLAREEEAQRYAIVSQRGGEPVCIGPDKSVYVRYPSLQSAPGAGG